MKIRNFICVVLVFLLLFVTGCGTNTLEEVSTEPSTDMTKEPITEDSTEPLEELPTAPVEELEPEKEKLDMNRTYSILFIGNSYTYYNDMPTLFSRLCGCNGKRAMVFSVTHGGRKLHENLDPNDPVTRQLDAVIAQNTMDVCILQEHSILPITDFDRFSANVTGLMDKLGPARFVLYQTWGRKTGSSFLTVALSAG